MINRPTEELRLWALGVGLIPRLSFTPIDPGNIEVNDFVIDVAKWRQYVFVWPCFVGFFGLIKNLYRSFVKKNRAFADT